MDAELRLTQVMQQVAGRHTDLQQAFRRFRQALREAMRSNVRYAPLPVTIGEIVEGYKFSAEIAGRVIWLVFSVRLDESDVAVGQMTALMPRAESTAPPIPLLRFALAKSGETGIEVPERPDGKLNVFVPADAAHLVLLCLRLALKREWE